MHYVLVKAAVLSSFSRAMRARIRVLWSDYTLDSIVSGRVDYVDGDGVGWTALALDRVPLTPERAARLGTLAAKRVGLAAYVDALASEDERLPLMEPSYHIDFGRLRAGVESVLAPQCVRDDADDGTPFGERTDLGNVLAEQGAQDVLVVVEAIPDGWTVPEAGE